jgi:hypothetical protein
MRLSDLTDRLYLDKSTTSRVVHTNRHSFDRLVVTDNHDQRHQE